MKVLVTILILAALIGSLLYFAHGAIKKFDETSSQEEPKPDKETVPEKLSKTDQKSLETQENQSYYVIGPVEQIKNERPRDPKTGRFIKKK